MFPAATTTMPAPAQPPIAPPPPPPPLPGPPPPLPLAPAKPLPGLPGLPGFTDALLPTLGPPPLWKMTPAPTLPPLVTTPAPPTTPGPTTPAWVETPFGLVAGTTLSPFLAFTTTYPYYAAAPAPAPGMPDMSAAYRAMLHDRVNSPDVTIPSLTTAISEAIVVANAMLAKLGSFASNPQAMINQELDSPAATVESLMQAIALAQRIGRLEPSDKYVVHARQTAEKWITCQRDPHEIVYEAMNDPDANFGSVTTAITMAKRFGGLTDSDKYVDAANAMLAKMPRKDDIQAQQYRAAKEDAIQAQQYRAAKEDAIQAQQYRAAKDAIHAGKDAFLTIQGKVEPWGGPLSFLFRSQNHHTERQPAGCDCPCTENDRVDRDFESILNFGR